MEGNRIAYMKKMVVLIKNISPPEKIEDIQGFHEDLQQKLDDFTKQSYRPYAIVSEFFANEAGRIAEDIKRFDSLDKGILKRYKLIGIGKINNISQKIKDYSKSGEILEDMKKEFEEKNKQMETIKSQIKESEEDLASLKESKESKNYYALRKDKEKIDEDIKNYCHNFLTPFSTIQHPLKKYSKIAMQNTEWIDAYLDDPIDALKSDESFILGEILSNIENNSASLNLNQKKLDRMMKTIRKIDKKFVFSFRDRLKQLEEKKKKIDSNLKTTTIIGQISKANEELESLIGREKIIAQHIEELESDISKIDLDKMRKDLIININRLLDVEIKLIS